MRVYLNNELITYLLRYRQGKKLQSNVQKETESLVFLSGREDIEILVSEESLAEIRDLHKNSSTRKDLEPLYFKLKQAKTVIRNSIVMYNDIIATYGSQDVFYSHSHNNTDLNRVKQFLSTKGDVSEFDAMYIANAMLPKNEIDVFLTADKKTIWNYRDEIEERFNVIVKLPTELIEK